MKLRKQIKNRIVAFAMLAVVLVCGFSFYSPQTVKASSFLSFDFTNLDFNGNAYYKSDGSLDHYVSQIQFSGDSKPTLLAIYCPYKSNGSFFIRFVAIGKGGLSVPKITTVYDNGETYINNGSSIGSAGSGLDSYSCYAVGGKMGGNGKANFSAYVIPTTPSEWNDYYNKFKTDADILMQYVKKYLANRDGFTYVSNGTDEYDNIPDGSQDNPIPDENIGTLVLKKSKCYWVKDGSMDVSQRVQWANKTDTDFSLTNNKYAITRIEVKIGNRVTYFGDVEHHGTGKKVDNFGKVYPFKYVIATDNPHDFSFKDMLSASKTDLTKYNAAMLEHEYDLYFRVVCGTAYGTSAEWHCGNWTRYRVTDDPKQDGKNESDNGHFNDNGEWEKDKDTDVDSGGIGNVDDKDDLEDDFNHFKDSENWKDWLNKEGLDLDSAKAFIDQVADVPKMIGDLFSFFPDWVKYSFAFGFGLIPVIIIIKFLRG